jgi:hypothetical protein
MIKWHKFWQLSTAERAIFIQALLILPAMALGLRGLGLRRLQAQLGGLSRLDEIQPLERSASQAQQAHSLARIVGAAAANGPYRATCLPQSLTVWWLLRRRGIASELRIGVRKEANCFLAHAWVEVEGVVFEGVVLNDQQDVPQRFAPFTQTGDPQKVSLQ